MLLLDKTDTCLEVRRKECIVNNQENVFSFVNNFSHSCNVYQFQSGIGRSLYPNQLEYSKVC